LSQTSATSFSFRLLEAGAAPAVPITAPPTPTAAHPSVQDIDHLFASRDSGFLDAGVVHRFLARNGKK
jgi:hypothetical protein